MIYTINFFANVKDAFKHYSTLKLKEHSPVYPICFYPGKAVLIDPKHQLQTPSNTLHILRALRREKYKVLRLESTESHETMHIQKVWIFFLTSFLPLGHSKAPNIFSKVNPHFCVSLCLLEIKQIFSAKLNLHRSRLLNIREVKEYSNYIFDMVW